MYLTPYYLVLQESNANELKIQTEKATTQAQMMPQWCVPSIADCSLLSYQLHSPYILSSLNTCKSKSGKHWQYLKMLFKKKNKI